MDRQNLCSTRAVVSVALVSLVTSTGCGLAKKAIDGADGGPRGAAVNVTAADAPPAATPIAANEEDVSRFTDETPRGNVAAVLQRDATNVREIPSVGKIVATLDKGTKVAEVARHGSASLVVFDNPKSQKKLMGWIGQDAFTATAAPSTLDERAKARSSPTFGCKAPEVPLVGDDLPFCGRVCTSAADCPSGQACKGAANQFTKAKVGAPVSICAAFTPVVRRATPPASTGGGAVAPTTATTPTPTTASSALAAAAPGDNGSTSGLPWCHEDEPKNPKHRPGEAPPPAPPPCRKPPTAERPTGAPCRSRVQCESNYCRPSASNEGACTACAHDSDCGPRDFFCTSDPKHRAVVAAHPVPPGICIYIPPSDDESSGGGNASNSGSSDDDTPSRRDTSSSSNASAKPKGSERGRMCGKDSDCQSGNCKMENRTRGRCQ